MKLIALLFLAGISYAQSCLPTTGTVDDVVYNAETSSMFGSSLVYLHLKSTDPAVNAFKVTVEMNDGTTKTPQTGVDGVLFMVNWCSIARVTIESQKTGSIHQIRGQ